MATYKKPTIMVLGTTVSGSSFLGDANTYESLKAHKTAKVYLGKKPPASGELKTKDYVPFHAVQGYAKVVYAEDATKADPYGCEGSSGKVRFINDGKPCGDGSVVAEFTVPVTLTEDNFPTVEGCSVSSQGYMFSIWRCYAEDSIDSGSLPITITEAKTYHSVFAPVY